MSELQAKCQYCDSLARDVCKLCGASVCYTHSTKHGVCRSCAKGKLLEMQKPKIKWS